MPHTNPPTPAPTPPPPCTTTLNQLRQRPLTLPISIPKLNPNIPLPHPTPPPPPHPGLNPHHPDAPKRVPLFIPLLQHTILHRVLPPTGRLTPNRVQRLPQPSRLPVTPAAARREAAEGRDSWCPWCGGEGADAELAAPEIPSAAHAGDAGVGAARASGYQGMALPFAGCTAGSRRAGVAEAGLQCMMEGFAGGEAG
ncbi:hypothetical protein BO71DRAFT_436744 [Aspergillus ellipticus CBS 707.79]|uniref:Uncharacterized protein n=1 Tax=Aspergillus ellipticus CBS 707.79 TaxID=1448320 RepID=A0A319CYE3_9EURO|nr:hypothetical protein BO71DRAFT_436744 [Aspergillus ellipticus CBS 707.79]